jgi:hypothetical protein
MTHDVSARLREAADAVDSWTRVGTILAVIVLNGIWEEMLILGAELMMLLRWTRDLLRYDIRWMVQEKMRLLGDRRTRSKE